MRATGRYTVWAAHLHRGPYVVNRHDYPGSALVERDRFRRMARGLADYYVLDTHRPDDPPVEWEMPVKGAAW